MSQRLRLSVKQLVEFACRSGDLESGPSGPSAAEGIRAHQRWQRLRGDAYIAEAAVSASFSERGYEIELGGRVDLLLKDSDPPLIEEIKSCYCHPDKLPEAHKDLHWAQLKVYGFCHLRCVGGTEIRLQMSWYNIPLREAVEDCRLFPLRELERFTLDALRRYVDWQQLVDAELATLRQSAEALTFPYPSFRPGQRTMAAAVYRSLRDGRMLMCEAPTGTGKTVSALFPAIKAMGTDQVDKIVYLTAKNSGRQAAMTAVQLMAASGLHISSLIIQARDRACHCLNGGCERDEQGHCPRRLGFFDRLPAAREQLLRQRRMSSEAIDAVAVEHGLCPFALSLQMLPWASVVICDFNYVFDPLVSLNWVGNKQQRLALLLDEAHNLVDRARQMHSAHLDRRQIRLSADECQSTHPLLSRALTSIDRALGRCARQCDDEETVSTKAPPTVNRAVQRLIDTLADTGSDHPITSPTLLDTLKAVYRYAAITDLFAEHHRCLIRIQRRDRRSNVEISLLCLNASDHLKTSYQQFHALILFSATLAPQFFYRRALGLPQECADLALPSPFSSPQQATLICPQIDTRYQHRDRAIETIVHLIKDVFSARPGNYLVFFPSYRFMGDVAQSFTKHYPALPIQLQQRHSSETDRHAFLQRFESGQATLGFAITGGIYGEGIDYCGDKLIGAIVVGTGLPAVSTEQQLIREDFQASGLNGFDFAYRYPGLTRVLQAAGRVIRSESDQGVVVLVDQRFAQAFYRRLLPAHWQIEICVKPDSLETALKHFWRRAHEAHGPMIEHRISATLNPATD